MENNQKSESDGENIKKFCEKITGKNSKNQYKIIASNKSFIFSSMSQNL